jgi:hypothetical protein
MSRLLEAVTRFLATVTSNGVSLAGSALTTVAAFLFVFLFGIHLVSTTGGPPYLGIITFLILPALFLLGLLVIPIGLWRVHKRRRQALAEDDPAAQLAVIDFNRPRTRRTALVFAAATGINALILGVGTYKGIEVMDSTRFCGATCHTVMQPEYTAYRRSPHARVECVECHIGPGANWFVKSKLSGSWQVVAVTFDLYPRPIPVPVQNLRPARETCEQCHWPSRFVGDRFKVDTHFADDEANTRTETVLVVKVGGQQAGQSEGIHWHVNPERTVRYRADEKRRTIYEVEMVSRDGTTKTWTSPAASTPEGRKATTWRTMDCIDCHNRPTHVFHSPESELDAALLERRIDPSLPYVRREGLKALLVDYPGHEAARAGIARQIAAFYAGSYPQVAAGKKDAVAAAGAALGDIWCWNVFPRMRVTWGTYVNDIRHTLDMSGTVGCFRCHDGEHTTADGSAIPQDCSMCHSILAMDEKNPKILETVFGE